MAERIEVGGWGKDLRETVIEAHEAAQEVGEDVYFQFNEWEIHVSGSDTLEEVIAKVEEQVGFRLLTGEERAREAAEGLDRMQREADEAMEKAGAPDEAAMAKMKVPWPKTEEELIKYIRSLVDRPHDYGTCVYAMSMSALAAFYYASSKLGVTGFQASMAEMDFLKRSRHMEMGFAVVNYADLLYPQYWDKPGRRAIFSELLKDEESRKYFAEKARELLEEKNDHAHPDVIQHWQNLATLDTQPQVH